jgi:hypothetical protein
MRKRRADISFLRAAADITSYNFRGSLLYTTQAKALPGLSLIRQKA